MRFVIALRCIECGLEYEPKADRYLCEQCGENGLLEVEYNYQKIKLAWRKENLKTNSDRTMCRYMHLLPINPQTPRPNLRVGGTPLYRVSKLGDKIGLSALWLKDDTQNPTGSLKDRASFLAVLKAQEAQATKIACSSTGNAASSLAGNVAALSEKMKAFIFVPQRAPAGKLAQMMAYGAEVLSVRGSYKDAYYLSKKAIERLGYYNRNAAINPYLIEGKKTVALEIAEQCSWVMPHWVVVSVGDGCTIAAVAKGFKDLYQLGWIDKVPRLLGVQASGCAPITKAFVTESPLRETEENTIADSIAVGSPRNGQKALMAVKESRGRFINVGDEEILTALKELATYTGIYGESAAAAAWAGLKAAKREKLIRGGERVILIITGSGLKDTNNALKATGEPLSVPNDAKELLHLFSKKGWIG